MNRIPLILIGVLFTVSISMFGLVLIPSWQLESLQPIEVATGEESTELYPVALDPETSGRGRRIYQSLGCIYCHSQQVREEGFGSDFDRGWGDRRSVPRDYVLQNPPLMGTMRTGPDLANIGFRQPSDEWHHLHLFEPTLMTPGSIMPPGKFLYELASGELSADREVGVDAFKLPDSYAAEPTWILPRPDALHLVAYLKTLHQQHDFEVVK